MKDDSLEVCKQITTMFDMPRISFPRTWLDGLRTPGGKWDVVASIILADIIWWYTLDHRETINEHTGEVESNMHKRFSGAMLQRSTAQLCKRYSLTRHQVNDALKRLEKQGLIKVVLRNVHLQRGGTAANVRFVEPVSCQIRLLNEGALPTLTNKTKPCPKNRRGGVSEKSERGVSEKSDTYTSSPRQYTGSPVKKEKEKGDTPPFSVSAKERSLEAPEELESFPYVLAHAETSGVWGEITPGYKEWLVDQIASYEDHARYEIKDAVELQLMLQAKRYAIRYYRTGPEYNIAQSVASYLQTRYDGDNRDRVLYDHWRRCLDLMFHSMNINIRHDHEESVQTEQQHACDLEELAQAPGMLEGFAKWYADNMYDKHGHPSMGFLLSSGVKDKYMAAFYRGDV